MMGYPFRMLLLGGFAQAMVGCGQQDDGQDEALTEQEPATEAEKAAQGTAATGDPGAAEITAAARTEAEQIFSTRCAVCHGEQGKGDGPGSKGLTPQPRDLTKAEWQESVTDEHIHKIIQYGGAAVGKAAAMPGNPDLVNKPAVVAALREHVRELKGK